jgi:hypothetical protein
MPAPPAAVGLTCAPRDEDPSISQWLKQRGWSSNDLYSYFVGQTHAMAAAVNRYAEVPGVGDRVLTMLAGTARW